MSGPFADLSRAHRLGVYFQTGGSKRSHVRHAWCEEIVMLWHLTKIAKDVDNESGLSFRNTPGKYSFKVAQLLIKPRFMGLGEMLVILMSLERDLG